MMEGAQRGLPQPGTLEGWRWWRNQSRTNLFFFCRRVLGYKDVHDPHRALISNLQQFSGGDDLWPAKQKGDKVLVGTLADGMGYVPRIPIPQLFGCRKTLNLISRGHLKTSIATIGHSIQWIINYPDVRLLLSSATDSQVKKFLDELKKHFQYNDVFRYLFPEFCPQGNVKEFGNQEQFTVPCRQLHRKEPTVSTVTVGSVMAGGHFDVVKNDDIVDKENVRTVDQIAVVESHVQMLGPLVERYNIPDGADEGITGWMDFVGTRYHYSDIYGRIIEHEEKRKSTAKKDGCEYKPEYKILVMPATVNGESIFSPTVRSSWPQRFPIKELQRIYADPLEGGSMFMSQYQLDPRPDGTGLIDSLKQIVWIPREVISRMYARLSLNVTIDLAGMESSKGSDNDYSVLTLAGWDRSAALYVLEVLHGRPDPFQVIELMFSLYKRHPRIQSFKVEKENHARVLLPFLKREMQKRGVFLPVEAIPRNNQQSKEQKIKGLIPWFRSGTIRFAEDIPCRDIIEQEILRFPKWHDDILDTLRDQMETKDGGVVSDVLPQAKFPSEMARITGKFLGFGPEGVEMWEGQATEPDPLGRKQEQSDGWSMIGAL